MDWRKELEKSITDLNMSYREFGSESKIIYSELSNIVKGSRGLSVKSAVKLERFGLKTAKYWLDKQTVESIYNEKNKCYKTDKVCKYKCKGLCRESC
jgi:plasmid maintenance system antidote protein VapI